MFKKGRSAMWVQVFRGVWLHNTTGAVYRGANPWGL